MPKKPLIKTNPYLKDPKRRQAMLRLSVISSTAVEGVLIRATDLRLTEKSTQNEIRQIKMIPSIKKRPKHPAT